MATPSPVDVAVNPNDTDQRYILWSTGRVDAVGGAPPITDGPNWYDRFDPPGVAIHITNWSTGAGYVLDYRGGFNPLNGAPALGTGSNNLIVSGVPISSSPTDKKYVDWSWDPGGSGKAIVLDAYGKLYYWNGVTPASRTGTRWTGHVAMALEVDWSGGQPAHAATLAYNGGIYGDYGTSATVQQPLWPGWSAGRDLVVTDWANPIDGYILNLYGGIEKVGAAEAIHGEPVKKADVARCLAVLSEDNPLEVWIVWSGGQSYDIVSSTAPTVTAGGAGTLSPSSTVTTTTRPVLAWDYEDTQGDTQATWEVYVFTQSFANAHSITDPPSWADDAVAFTSGTDPERRGVVLDYDFTNGSYRFFVRASDTSGLYSDWDSRDWTQNVPAPATPTGLQATVDNETHSVSLSVNCATGGSADTVAFGYSDDGGVTWGLVRGSDAVELESTTFGTDFDVPSGVTRMYRAVAYNDSPRVVSASSSSISVTTSFHKYLLTSVDDWTLGGEIKVVDAPSWSREAKAGVFEGAGARYPVVVSDGTPKARRLPLGIECDLRAEWTKISELIESDSTLVYRDPFGEVVYCRIVGTIGREQIRRFPDASESTPLRHSHKVTLPLVEVEQPTTLDLSNTVPPGPA